MSVCVDANKFPDGRGGEPLPSYYNENVGFAIEHQM